MTTRTKYTWVCDLCGCKDDSQIPPGAGFIPIDWTELAHEPFDQHICPDCRGKILNAKPQEE